MKMLRAAEPPLPSWWGWAEIITLTELISFNPLQTDHLREIKGYKRLGQLPYRTHHPSFTFQEIVEPLSYLGGELSSFLPRILFQRQQHFPSKHIPLQANWLWACSCLPGSIWGWMWLMATWTTINIGTDATFGLVPAGGGWGGNTVCGECENGLLS